MIDLFYVVGLFLLYFSPITFFFCSVIYRSENLQKFQARIYLYDLGRVPIRRFNSEETNTDVVTSSKLTYGCGEQTKN